MPLIDSLGRRHNYLRISVTDRCNLRCVYCMPAAGVPWRPRTEILSLEEVHRVARVMVQTGVEKIRLTGGEPLVRKGLLTLIEKLSALSGLKTLAMTTNGMLLARQARALRAAGMHSLNVSLDTLRPARFREITLREGFDDVLQGIDAALEAGFVPLKLNVVVMAGLNDDELPDFVEFVRTRPIDVRFIEFMPFPGNSWNREQLVPWQAMKATIERYHELIPDGSDDNVAKGFRISGFQGRISFISPLSEDFCAACSRLRLTADGAIKSCLFYPSELSLRSALRCGASDAALEEMIRGALRQKRPMHPEAHVMSVVMNRCMTAIGG